MAGTRDQVSFLLNGVRHDVPRSVPPTRTLLDYLREDLRLTGTKEGCNEGDCGACTVVVTGPDGVARAVNACIQFVPMVDGLAVTTVEGLRGPEGGLHPVQQAMVECHGSQCGYCTPGFVMSLYAAYREYNDALEGGQLQYTGRIHEYDELLAGNLCRCTGYGPIVDAARRLLSGEQQTGQHKGEPLCEDSLALDHPQGKYFAPRTIDELASLYERYPHATILGGATDVGLWVTKQHRDVTVLISTARVLALKECDHDQQSGRFVIGAGLSYSELRFMWLYWPDLAELVRRIGSVQVRNSGTIGGNIANGSPIGDIAPALMALGASIELRKGQAQRSIPMEDFFIAYGRQDRQPGEFLLGVSIPVELPAQRKRLRCYKISKRFDQDISAVLGCFNLHIEAGMVAAARIAFGGMAGIPKRAKSVEAALTGKPWTMATVEAALPAFESDFQPLTDMRASAEYRMLTAKNLMVRYFHETTSDAPTRLVGDGALEAMGSDPIGLQ